jgi:hypothetical protein
VLAHRGISGPAPFVAVGLLLLGVGAFIGAAWMFRHPVRPWNRAAAIGLGAVGAGCFIVGTILPFLLGASPSLSRPSSTAQLAIASPASGQTLHGDPATVHVVLTLEGGQVVPFSSLRLVPNEGHIHLFVDGRIVSMSTGLTADLAAPPGTHELEAEFVAVDHGSFDPRVTATTTFAVVP